LYIIEKKSKIPLHIQLYEEVKKEILSSLQMGDKLNSIRKVATTYSISKTSVESAYSQLIAEGYITSYPQKGYFVSKSNDDNINNKSQIITFNEEPTKQFLYNFHPARLESSSFPLKIWKRIFNKTINDSIDFGCYTNAKGEYGLRNEISKYLIESRGVKCNPNQIIICNGFGDSMQLLIKLLGTKTDTLAMEHPGYYVTSEIFKSNNYSIKKIPVYKEGIDLNSLEKSNAKLVYLTPSHQYPTGVTIPISNRIKLLDWADKNDAFIIEDDYDSELTYENRPVPCMQGLDKSEKVIYVGTFAKSLSPSMRISYMVLPKILFDNFSDIFESKVCLFTQKTLENFMKEGHWDRQLRKMRTLNKKKYNLLKKLLKENLGKSMQIVNKGGGLSIHIYPTVAFDLEKLNTLALEESIKLHFAKNKVGGDWDAIMMGFGGLKEIEIEPAVKIFTTIWNKSIL